MPRKMTMKSVDAMIEQLEEKLRNLKGRCAQTEKKLSELYEKRKKMEAEELLAAFRKSRRTKAEVMAFLEGHS